MTRLEGLCFTHGKRAEGWHLALEKIIGANAVFWIFMQAEVKQLPATGKRLGKVSLAFACPDKERAAVPFLNAAAQVFGCTVEITRSALSVSHETFTEQAQNDAPLVMLDRTKLRKKVYPKMTREERAARRVQRCSTERKLREARAHRKLARQMLKQFQRAKHRDMRRARLNFFMQSYRLRAFTAVKQGKKVVVRCINTAAILELLIRWEKLLNGLIDEARRAAGAQAVPA
jgi:hypothetical protein